MEKMHRMEAAVVAKHTLKGCCLGGWPKGWDFQWTVSKRCGRDQEPGSTSDFRFELERMRVLVLGRERAPEPKAVNMQQLSQQSSLKSRVWQLATSQLFQLELDNSHNYPNRSAHIMPSISIIPIPQNLQMIGKGVFYVHICIYVRKDHI